MSFNLFRNVCISVKLIEILGLEKAYYISVIDRYYTDTEGKIDNKHELIEKYFHIPIDKQNQMKEELLELEYIVSINKGVYLDFSKVFKDVTDD